MNITGVLRIDLSSFVEEFNLLYIGDTETSAIYHVAYGFVGDAILDIGSAKNVEIPDRRLNECFAGIESLTVVGTNAQGVVHALESIRRIQIPAQHGPEAGR